MQSVDILPALDRYGFYFFQCLISFLWQSTFVLGPVLAALWIFRKRRPALRNSIALTGFLAVLVILALSWFLGLSRLPGYPIPVMPDYRADWNRLPGPDPVTDFGGIAPARSVRPGESIPRREADYREPSGTLPLIRGPESLVSRSSWHIFSYPWALGLLAYFLIQAYLVLKLLLEWGLVRWWIWRSRIVEDFDICRVFWRAAFFLDVRTSRFMVMQSRSLSIPVTVGAIHPRIILPDGFVERCSREDFRAVVYHELAHVYRHDPLFLTIISVLRTVLFFHPLVQLTAREFTLIAEQASDEAAIEESGASPAEYARSLTRVVESLSSQALKSSLALGIFRRRSLFFHRLELILSGSGRTCRPCRPLLSTAAIAGFVFFLSAAISLPLVQRDPGSVETAALKDAPSPPVVSLAPPYTACAIPVRNIRIDGRLNDWPGNMIRYPISSHIPGDPAIPDNPRETAPDSHPWMMVGFSPDDGFLYVAVAVPDDRTVIVWNPEWASPDRTDACEIYVDGTNLSRRAGEDYQTCSAWDLPAVKYMMCPEGAAYDRGAWLNDPPYTPALFRGNIRRTGCRCVSRRSDGITTYEWAVPAYTRYPAQPLFLQPGTIIRFDVVVRDCDESLGVSTLTAWGQPDRAKVFNPSKLGKVVLVERYEDLGFVRGTISRCREPYANHRLRISRGSEWMGEFSTDRYGVFQLMLPPGRYTIHPDDVVTEERLNLDAFTVASGALVKPRFTIPMNGFSRLRHETGKMLRTVRNIRS